MNWCLQLVLLWAVRCWVHREATGAWYRVGERCGWPLQWSSSQRPMPALRTAGCARRRGRHQAGGHMHMPLPGHSRMMLKAQFSKPAFNYHKSSPIHYEQRREKLLHSAWLSIYCTQFLLQLLLADEPKWHSVPNFQRPAHGWKAVPEASFTLALARLENIAF